MVCCSVAKSEVGGSAAPPLKPGSLSTHTIVVQFSLYAREDVAVAHLLKVESVQLKIDKNKAWYASKMAGTLSAHHSFKDA